MVVNAAQLASYSQAKQAILGTGNAMYFSNEPTIYDHINFDTSILISAKWYSQVCKLRPPRGSLKLIRTNLTNLVSLEQFHHKPMGMNEGDLLDMALGGK